jgi:hypothetical protein
MALHRDPTWQAAAAETHHVAVDALVEEFVVRARELLRSACECAEDEIDEADQADERVDEAPALEIAGHADARGGPPPVGLDAQRQQRNE